MARYRLGAHVPQGPRLRSIKRRALWAARMAGVKADALQGIRWKFVESITAQDRDATTECGGLCYRTNGTLHIVIATDPDWAVEGYVVHELVHAALWSVEADRDADGNPCNEHGSLFRALLRTMRRAYANAARGPRVVG